MNRRNFLKVLGAAPVVAVPIAAAVPVAKINQAKLMEMLLEEGFDIHDADEFEARKRWTGGVGTGNREDLLD